ncbi:DNA polymerase III subunit gamma/tau [Colwellia sp. MEBiC06753]
MSYQVLARKWRPKTFNELMGQEHVVSVLVNAITQQRLHHAYLFTGTRGVGKTTIARIFAKSLNCEQGISAEPCGQCDVCQDIDQGRFVDLLEIDAASRTKVDDTREILDNVQYAPTRGRYKVYLIDEVHMLSRSSFNALLKTLEEPPAHVKFILATTDPQKLPITVLSRCLQFHLKALSVAQIAQQLTKILAEEKVTFEDESINMLAKAARGSMRDSLSLTDQAIAQGQGHISVANLQQMLGGVDQHWAYKILILLLKQDSNGLMELSKEIASYAPSYQRLYAELIQLLHHVALYQIVQNHFDLSPEHAKLTEKFSQAMSADEVQLYYQLALNGRKDLPYVGDEQAAFDMTLLRLLAFKPAQKPAKQEVVSSTSEQLFEVDFSDIALADSQVTSPEVAEVKLPQSELAAAKKDLTAREIESSAVGQVDAEIDENTANTDCKGFESQLNDEMLAIEQAAATQFVQQSTDLIDESSTEALSAVEQGEDVKPSTEFHSDHLAEQPAEMSVDKKPSISAAEDNKNAATTEPDNTNHFVPNTNILDVDGTSSEASTSASANVISSPVESALATRNMLRSRKKKLESAGKKSNDAEERQQVKAVQVIPDVPAIETLPEQGFSPDAIDPAVIKKANQVDKWANMIDTMALNGRLRVLAQHAIIDQQSTGEHLILLLNQSAKHLKTEVAMEQLQAFVGEYFNQPVTVEVKIVEQTAADPIKIQGQINEKRYEYAKTVLSEDPVVQSLQQIFQAELDESSIIAR